MIDSSILNSLFYNFTEKFLIFFDLSVLKKFLIFLLLVFLGGSGYFIYKKYLAKEDLDTWDLIPSTAFAVYESERTIQVWNDFTQTNIWANLSSIPAINDFSNQVSLFDSITGSNGSLDRLIREKTFLVSFHKTSNHTLDRILYIPLINSEHRRTVNAILDYFKESDLYIYQTRVFQDMDITELKQKETSVGFSYVIYKNHFITSGTSFLIEDVIRNITNNFQVNFRLINRDIFKVPPIKNDEGNLYLDLRQLTDFVKTFIDPQVTKGIGSLNWIGGASYFDITLEDNTLLLNGSVSIPYDDHDYFLSTFLNQTPQDLNSLHLLPSRTASYLIYSFEDIQEWRMNVDAFWEDHYPALIERKADMLEEMGIYEKDLYGWIGNEIGIASLESVDLKKPEKLIFIGTNDLKQAQSVLNDLAMVLSYNLGDSVYMEMYMEIPIRQISIEQFPARLFGDQFSGFNDCFYAPVDQYIILGNSSDVLKSLISDIAEENTWGKSVRINQFMENNQKRSNIGLYINFSRAWSHILEDLNDSWRNWFVEYSFQLKQWELFAVQFTNINQNFYCSQSLKHRESTSVIQTPKEFLKEQVVVTEYPIITKPEVVHNHNDRSLEVLVQDSVYQIYLISSNGEILWKDSLDGPVTGDVFQIDFYKNGKLQYLIPSLNRIHLIDRNGNAVDDYPLNLNDSVRIRWFNVIDYDKSKNYRYMVSDDNGNIYLYDKYGINLEGWTPREIGESLSTNPFHMRIRARDCMVVVQENGVINVMNRRGEMLKNFPIDLNYAIRGAVFVEKGADFQKTLFNIILQSGELIKFDLEGKTTGTLQLYKPGRDTWFEIVPDITERTYVIGRKDFNRISFINKEGDVLFEKELLTSDEIKFQYYNFGADNQIFIVIDEKQEFTYLFNQDGAMINQQPIESGHEIGLIFSERNNKFNIYSCYANQFAISSFYKQ